MSTMILDADRFYGGAPIRLESWMRLITPDERKVRVRAGIVILVGYFPLVLLAGIQDLAYGGNSLHSLLVDFGSLARYLIAAPLFVLAESVCFPKFQRVISYFRDCGLIAKSDRDHYENLVRSSVRLLRSKTAEIVSYVIAYVITVYCFISLPHSPLISWSYGSGTGLRALSPAGLWHAVVTIPLFVVLALGWLWRQLSWARFIWSVSRMDLQLIAAHPDQCGGLKFIATIIHGYRPLAFAWTAIIAGGIANRIANMGASLGTFRDVMIAVVVVVGLLCVAPLGAFAPSLRRLRANGTFDYGRLGREIGGQFEQKWLAYREHWHEGLHVPDFSATTDLYSVVGNVYKISPIPFGFNSVRDLLIFAALPFVPVLLMAQSVQAIVDTLVKLAVS
jgi:hypothetical protein